jgi:hypothetical protein
VCRFRFDIAATGNKDTAKPFREIDAFFLAALLLKRYKAWMLIRIANNRNAVPDCDSILKPSFHGKGRLNRKIMTLLALQPGYGAGRCWFNERQENILSHSLFQSSFEDCPF